MTDFTSPLTVDGVPVSGNGIPVTFGDYFYADAANGDDANDGKTMKTAKATILAAYNLMASGNDDVLLIAAVSGFTFTAELDVAKNNVHFRGLGASSRWMGHGARFGMSTGGSANSAVLKVTGKRCTFADLKITNSDSSTSFAVADGGEFTQWTRCEIVNTQNLGTVTDAHLLCNADTGYYYRCVIGSSQAGHAITGARGNVLFSRTIISGKVCRDSTFEECLFPIQSTSATASVFLLTTATDVERVLWVKGCTFWGTKLSGTINRAIQIDINQTDGDIFLDPNCSIHGIDDLTADSTTSVYHRGGAASVQLAMVAVEGGET